MTGRGGEKMMRKGREDERRSGGEVKRRRWNGGNEEGRERGGAVTSSEIRRDFLWQRFQSFFGFISVVCLIIICFCCKSHVVILIII